MAQKPAKIPDHWQGMILKANQHNAKQKGWLVVCGPVNDDGTIKPVEKKYFGKSRRKARRWLGRKTDIDHNEIRIGVMYPHALVMEALEDEPQRDWKSMHDWWISLPTVPGQIKTAKGFSEVTEPEEYKRALAELFK